MKKKLELQKSRIIHTDLKTDSNVWFKVMNAGPYFREVISREKFEKNLIKKTIKEIKWKLYTTNLPQNLAGDLEHVQAIRNIRLEQWFLTLC